MKKTRVKVPKKKPAKKPAKKPTAEPRMFRLYGTQPTSALYPKCCIITFMFEGRRLVYEGFAEAARVPTHATAGEPDWLPEKYHARALAAVADEHPDTWKRIVTVWARR